MAAPPLQVTVRVYAPLPLELYPSTTSTYAPALRAFSTVLRVPHASSLYASLFDSVES